MALKILRSLVPAAHEVSTREKIDKFAVRAAPEVVKDVSRPEPVLGGKTRRPVPNSEELERILAIPRRPVVDLEEKGGRAERLVEMMTARLRYDNPKCKCASYGRKCITRLTPAQAWSLYEAQFTGGLVGGIAVGGGKCLDGSAEIFDVKAGRRRTVAETVSALSVPSVVGGRLSTAAGSSFPSGRKHCVHLTLRDGSSVVASDDHPVLTGRGWVPAGDVAESDFVAVPRHMPDPESPLSISDDEVALLAFLIADGSFTKSTIRFNDDNPAVLSEVRRCSTAVCGGYSEHATRSKATELSILDAQAFKARWGLHELSKHKRLDPRLWGLSTRHVALFVNRFWACDGHVSKVGLECTLASEGLIDDLRFLLLRLGVRTRKFFKMARCAGKQFPAWRITITGADAVQFFEAVGDVLGSEWRCQALRERLASSRRNTNTDILPVGYDEFSEICDEMGWPGKGAPRNGLAARRTPARKYLSVTAGQYVSRENFYGFCREFGYSGKYSNLLIDGVAWERVAGVTDAGERDVYDLNVPGSHNFVANNIVVHNTGLNILAPTVIEGCKRAVLLIPPNLVKQFVAEYHLWKEHWKVPALVYGNNHEQGSFPPGAGAVLYVVPYSKFSRPESTDILKGLRPDLIIGDEVHRLRHAQTATTSRVFRYADENESTKFCGWSGTLFGKSIEDCYHLFAFALREGSPLPTDPDIIVQWAGVIDPAPGDVPTPPGELRKLCAPGEYDVRAALHHRIAETKGYVSTKVGSVGASLIIHERKPQKTPQVVSDLLAVVRGEWVRPDGEEFVDILQATSCARELACGFYYKWRYPFGSVKSDGCTCTRQNPEICVACIETIKLWLLRRKAWNRELREKLKTRVDFLDSPQLCTEAAIRFYQHNPPPLGIGKAYEGELPVWMARHWPEWLEISDSVHPLPDAVWVDDFLAKDAADWAKTHRGVVWYEHDALGRRIAELSGLPLHGGGPNAESAIAKETGKRSIIASIKSHGTGRDGLQFKFREQLIVNPPGSASTFEQLLGRLHRQGQEADEVETWIYRHEPEVADAFDNALRYARFVEALSGNCQKLLSANLTFDLD